VNSVAGTTGVNVTRPLSSLSTTISWDTASIVSLVGPRGPSNGVIQFQVQTGGYFPTAIVPIGQSIQLLYLAGSDGGLIDRGAYVYSSNMFNPGYCIVNSNNKTTRYITVTPVLAVQGEVLRFDGNEIITLVGPIGIGADSNPLFTNTGLNLNNYGSYWTTGATGGATGDVIRPNEWITGTSISTSGQYQAIVTSGNTGATGATGNVYLSNDYGTTFVVSAGGATGATGATGTNSYNSIAMSSTGQYVVASYWIPLLTNGATGQISFVKSSDYGNTWSTVLNIGAAGVSTTTSAKTYISISSTGQYVALGLSGADVGTTLYLSSNFGTTFFGIGYPTVGVFSVDQIAVSASGQYMILCGPGGTMYSRNYGFNWSVGTLFASDQGVPGFSVAISASGQFAYVGGRGANPSLLYKNTNSLYGGYLATTARIPFSNASSGFYSISCSETGQYVTAVGCSANSDNYLFTSTDFGQTWFRRTITGTLHVPHRSVSVSGSGQYTLIGGGASQNGSTRNLYSIGIANPVTPILGGTAGSLNGVYYDTTSKNLYYSATKTFVIDNPVHSSKYLVHGCLEGPEAGVYYRGKGEITNDTCVIIELPYYVSSLATNFSVQVSAIFNGKINNYNVSNVIDNKFVVYGNNGKFHWIVYGTRQELDVDPNKSDVVVKGEGPYLWI
jgi:hypothetical protein